MVIEYLKDHKGEERHILIESRVSNIEIIKEVVQKIPQVKDDRLIRDDRLHLTWYKWGEPSKLRRSVLKESRVDEESYEELWGGFLTSTRDECEKIEGVNLKVVGVELFYPVLALLLDPTDQTLIEKRGAIHHLFTEFLEKCGIEDYRLFMRGNYHLKFQLPETYRPHISFARLDSLAQTEIGEIPEASIYSGKPRLRNVIFRQ